MAVIDINLSNIDTVGYVAANEIKAMPSVLDLFIDGSYYKFNLTSAHLWEKHAPARKSSACHVHDVYHIVLYVGGTGVFTLNNKVIPAKRGLLVLVSPGEPHQFTPDSGWVVYHAITFSLISRQDTALVEPIARVLSTYSGTTLTTNRTRLLPEPNYAAIKAGMEKVVHTLRLQPRNWFTAARQFLELIGSIANTEDFAVNSDGDHNLEEKIRSCIEANFADPTFSLTSMAGILHASSEHICRVFHSETGMTPIAYRNLLRIEAAKNMLRNSNLPCKTIADRLGYSDPYTFSKSFRRSTGHPPSRERSTNTR